MSDSVNKPAHYNQGSVETIDGIRAALGEGFADYCKGNVLKYVWRCGLKGDAVEDLRKAATYLEWAIEAMESNCPEIPDSSDRKPLAIPSGWRELEPDEVPVSTDMHEWMGGWFYRNDDATHEYCWFNNRHIRKIESDETKPIEIPDGPIAIPYGWRELQVGETLSKTDMYESNGKWNPYVDSNPAGSDFSRYSKGLHYRHIRKIETDERKQPAIPDGWRELEPDEFPRVTDMYESEGAWRNRINDSSFLYARYEVRHIRKIKPANPSETPNSSTPTEWIPKVGDKVRVVCATPFPKEDRFGIVVKDNVRPREDLFLVKTSNGISSWFYTSELHLIEAAP